MSGIPPALILSPLRAAPSALALVCRLDLRNVLASYKQLRSLRPPDDVAPAFIRSARERFAGIAQYGERADGCRTGNHR